MDAYDESEDIENRLRSALRGEQANAGAATVAGGQSADSEESATRRRRIRFGDNAFAELHPLSEEEHTDKARAAMLNSAIPEESRTPMGSKAQTRIDKDLWKDCTVKGVKTVP